VDAFIFLNISEPFRSMGLDTTPSKPLLGLLHGCLAKGWFPDL
jgi:hypothetical protein